MKVTRRQTIGAGGAALALTAMPGWAQDAAPDAPSPLTLWYDRPATDWVEALPIGNGRIGGMVFGGITSERIQLNEDSLFSGGPYDADNPEAAAAIPEIRRLIFAGRYAEGERLADAKAMAKPLRQMSYQPVGDLMLLFPGLENAREYRRELDLDGAIARTRFRVGSAVHVREVITSAVDKVMALRLTAQGRGGVTATIAFASPQAAEVTRSGADTLLLSGVGPDSEGIEGRVRFAARVRLIHDGGRLIDKGDSFYVQGAKEVVLLVAMATSYRGPDDVAGDPEATTAATLAAVGDKSWARILADHQTDHRRLFRACSIDLGPSKTPSLPTDERIRRSAELDDPALAALYHQLGRYLLIASSRAGGQPANLQGIWNEKANPSWGSKWTININTEMNYWPATMTGLGACIEPLLRMVQQLAVTGRDTARKMYRARGWVAHHNTDLFRQTAPIDGAKYGLWPMGGAWLLQNLWDHWDYSRDRAFLAEIYPLMTGACDFYLDTLQPHPRTGELVTNPSLSPENAHPKGASLCAGPTMDNQLLRDLFGRTAEAARLLGLDAASREQLLAARARLPKDKIGKAGQLQEWLDDWDMEAPEPDHRHVSHLYGLYPSEQIDKENTPALAAAARRSLELRGDDATGWSIGWKLNLWAKLGDGERAHKILKMLLEPRRTYPNMFDAHPPFQIDGNFGGTAGITQMLVQSHAGRVHLLPALPRAWPQGSIRGVRVRGGGEVDLNWSAGRLTEARLRSRIGGRYRLRHRGQDFDLTLTRGGERRLRLDRSDRLVTA
jgi:alpha-L-fucosidase 2